MSSRAALLVVAVLLAGCGRHAEPWISPDAKFVIEHSLDDQAGSTQLRAKSPSRVRIPRGWHELRIEAPGRAPLTARIDSATVCTTRTVINEYCPDDDDEKSKKHPANWLRRDDAPFELPPPGQGIVVTADAANTEISLRGNGVNLRKHAPASTSRGSLPLVFPLDTPGTYSVGASVSVDESGSKDVNVKAGEYAWVHFHLVNRPTYGSGWLR